jgi:hypothetical protein
MIGFLQRIAPWQASGPGPQDEQPTMAAGIEAVPAAGATPPGFRERGRLRRRLRYLRRVRELGFRDLGGLVFDLHRFGRSREDLVQAKLAALHAVDSEMRALEVALDDRRAITELREPGISSCARCGALHGTDARFCPSCGLQLSGPRPLGEVGLPHSAPPATTVSGDREGSSAVAPAPAAAPTPTTHGDSGGGTAGEPGQARRPGTGP